MASPPTNIRVGRYDATYVDLSWAQWTRPLPAGTYVNIYGEKNNSGAWTLLGSTPGDEWECWRVAAPDDGVSTWGFSLSTVDPTTGETVASAVAGLAGHTCSFDHRWGGAMDIAGESVSGPYPVWAFNPPQQVTFCGLTMTFLFHKGLGLFNSTDAHVWGYLDIYNYKQSASFISVSDPNELELVRSLMFDLPVGTFYTGGGSNTIITLPQPPPTTEMRFRFNLRITFDDSGGFDQIPLYSDVFTVDNGLCSPSSLFWTPPTLPLTRRGRSWSFVIG